MINLSRCSNAVTNMCFFLLVIGIEKNNLYNSRGKNRFILRQFLLRDMNEHSPRRNCLDLNCISPR
jgi:hypothetical protein